MTRRDWMPFSEARAFARSLGLLGQNEWFAYARGDLKRLFGARPENIPFNPGREYRGRGWRGLRDWLGPPPVEPEQSGYLDFRRARALARGLGLSTARDWRDWCAGRIADLPPPPGNVPEHPARMYPRAWRGWGDWLGTARSRNESAGTTAFLPFDDARAFVRALGLANVKEWRAFCKTDRPPDIPANPDNVYRHSGWNGYGDWLGSGEVSARLVPHLPYEDAQEVVRHLGLASGDEFRAWTRGLRPDLPPAPAGMPTNPNRVYDGDGWTTWGAFSGTDNVYSKPFPPFARTRALARSLGLANHQEWYCYVRGELEGRAPPDGVELPVSADAFYRDRGWTTWGDFLGTGRIATTKRHFRSFASARRFARSLRLRTVAGWRDYIAGELPDRPPLPTDIPASPDARYKDDGWNGWPDFLGRRGYRRAIRSFEEARALARSIDGLTSGAAWRAWVRGERPDLPAPPDDLPLAPRAAYRAHGWLGWGDFLGTGRLAPGRREWRSFEDARAFARTLGLRSRQQWDAWGRSDTPATSPRPADIPAKPHVVYASRWRGWRDFLGTE